MKLYILDAYYLKVADKASLIPGIGAGEPITIPVPVFIIQHPQGAVVFDTGLCPEHWPEDSRSDAIMPDKSLTDLIKEKTGIDCADIRYVIMSHLHLDHTGGMELFPNATFVVRRQELKEAWWPKERGGFSDGYMFEDILPTRYFNFVELKDGETFDLFGDGSVMCIDTKGHSIGHQSVVLNLPQMGTVVLTADACYFKENLQYRIKPGAHAWDSQLALESLDIIKQYEDNGAKLIFGHDPVQWSELKKAPEFYE